MTETIKGFPAPRNWAIANKAIKEKNTDMYRLLMVQLTSQLRLKRSFKDKVNSILCRVSWYKNLYNKRIDQRINKFLK